MTPFMRYRSSPFSEISAPSQKLTCAPPSKCQALHTGKLYMQISCSRQARALHHTVAPVNLRLSYLRQCDSPGAHIFQVHFAVQFDADGCHAVVVVMVMVVMPVACSQQFRLHESSAYDTIQHMSAQISREFRVASRPPTCFPSPGRREREHAQLPRPVPTAVVTATCSSRCMDDERTMSVGMRSAGAGLAVAVFPVLLVLVAVPMIVLVAVTVPFGGAVLVIMPVIMTAGAGWCLLQQVGVDLHAYGGR